MKPDRFPFGEGRSHSFREAKKAQILKRAENIAERIRYYEASRFCDAWEELRKFESEIAEKKIAEREKILVEIRAK